MDIFVEQLLKKRRSINDNILLFFVVVLAIGLILIGLFFVPSYLIFVLGIVCYGVWFFIDKQNLEFEYSVTNGYITIDKIIGKRKRERIISFESNEIYRFQKFKKEDLNKGQYNKKFITCDDVNSTNLWCASFHHKEYGNAKLVFSPNEDIINAIKPFLKRQVLVDAFSRD